MPRRQTVEHRSPRQAPRTEIRSAVATRLKATALILSGPCTPAETIFGSSAGLGTPKPGLPTVVSV
jgi:hypothetical protein